MNIFNFSTLDNTDFDFSENILESPFIMKCFSHSVIVEEYLFNLE